MRGTKKLLEQSEVIDSLK